MSQLEDFLKRHNRRRSSRITKPMSVDFIKQQVICGLEELNLINRNVEIIDLDIPGLTTGLVDVTIYTKEV